MTQPNDAFEWSTVGPDDPRRWGDGLGYVSSFVADGLPADYVQDGVVTPGRSPAMFLRLPAHGCDSYACFGHEGGGHYPDALGRPRRFLEAALLARIAEIKAALAAGTEYRFRIRAPGDFLGNKPPAGYLMLNAWGQVLRREPAAVLPPRTVAHA